MHRKDHSGLARGKNPKTDIITQDQMRDLIRAEAEAAGNVTQLCRNLRMRSAAPVHLALQEERAVSDRTALHFGFAKEIMYRRIARGPLTKKKQ